MRTVLLIVSSLLSIMSILPWILIQINMEYFKLVTFGQKGPAGLVLPLVYAFLSLILAVFLKKGKARVILLICSSLFLIWNIIITLLAVVLAQQ
ncbi:hypothetical protein [Thalassobacillus devorans]|uniref:hypothetical protein n=1 Tax=Thalassobacillus devorans TaxID=279813 RepID=UPI000A1CEA53|nr:hypothetical protein [Thalassobacillus devorans]